MRVRRGIVVMGVVALSLGLHPAAAGLRGVDDPDDSGGFLDVAFLRHSATDEGRVRHRVVMFGPWRNWQLERRAYLDLYFQVPDGPDRRVSISYVEGQLRGRMSERVDHESRDLGPVRVRRADRRSVVVSFPVRMLGEDVEAYRWSATTLTHDAMIPATPTQPHIDPQMHSDVAPDRDGLRHDLK